MAAGFKHLRVEEAAPVAVADQILAPRADAVKPDLDVKYWRDLAVATADRLSYCESQLKDLRVAADDARARFTKYKQRGDTAQARCNDLQAQLVKVSAERDDLRGRIARQAEVSRLVHKYRQDILDGPIWELFRELASSPLQAAGGSASTS